MSCSRVALDRIAANAAGVNTSSVLNQVGIASAAAEAAAARDERRAGVVDIFKQTRTIEVLVQKKRKELVYRMSNQTNKIIMNY
jgi:hypothetical protein